MEHHLSGPALQTRLASVRAAADRRRKALEHPAAYSPAVKTI
jgi:hypothetical protein